MTTESTEIEWQFVASFLWEKVTKLVTITADVELGHMILSEPEYRVIIDKHQHMHFFIQHYISLECLFH